MRIVGVWGGSKGNEYPYVDGTVSAVGQQPLPVEFALGSSIEATTITRATFDALKLADTYLPAPPRGRSRRRPQPFVRVPLTIEFLCPPDPPYRIIGMMNAAVDPAALSRDVLGLDELRHFRVIASLLEKHVLLLRGPHKYQLTGPP